MYLEWLTEIFIDWFNFVNIFSNLNRIKDLPCFHHLTSLQSKHNYCTTYPTRQACINCWDVTLSFFLILHIIISILPKINKLNILISKSHWPSVLWRGIFRVFSNHLMLLLSLSMVLQQPRLNHNLIGKFMHEQENYHKQSITLVIFLIKHEKYFKQIFDIFVL